MTVIVYIPSWPPMDVMSSISTILPAIRNRIPTGAYLRIVHECYCEFVIERSNTSFCINSIHTPLRPSILPSLLPHDYGDQPHDGFIETVKEVLEGLSLFPHAPDDQTEAHGEHHQAESIDSINRPWHWDHLLPRYLLATIDREYSVIHCHLHMDYSLCILRLELGLKKERGRERTFEIQGH